jgi:glycerol-3-phosphate O-acyltransferase
LLSIYRNPLTYLFSDEGIVSISFEYLKNQKDNIINGVPIEDLLESINFVSKLLSLEFINKEGPNEYSDFKMIIEKMVERSIFLKKDDRLYSNTKNLIMHEFLLSMFHPFIEAYWVAAMSLFQFQLTGFENESPIPSDQGTFVQRTLWLAEKFFREGKLIFFESINKLTFENAFSTYLNMGVLTKITKQIKKKGKLLHKNKVEFESKILLQLDESYMQLEKYLGFVSEIGKYRSNSNFINLSVNNKAGFPLISRL